MTAAPTGTRNVFVLNTGRCGSTTFIRACSHITNYTTGHESRRGRLGSARFDYPPDHIEADNRLSWLLGRLDREYGADAVYVHLYRNTEDVVSSFVKRYDDGIIKAYRGAILMNVPPEVGPEQVAADYCETVTDNIAAFLKDKPHKIEVSLDNAREDFRRFWQYIGAEGSLDTALAEFDVKYNASDGPRASNPLQRLGQALRALRQKAHLRTRIRRFME